MDTKGVKVADIYKALVGGRADTSIATRLGGADVRAQARAELFNTERARTGAPRSLRRSWWAGRSSCPVGAADRDARAAIGRGREGHGRRRVRRALLGLAGGRWLVQEQLLPRELEVLRDRETWASYGWYRGPTNFKATGFAQSHCSGAKWLFQRKAYGGFPFYGIALSTLADMISRPGP